jgi:hypothetical protein
VDCSESAPLLAEADHRIVRSFTEVDRVLADLEAQGIEPAAVATMGSDQAVLPTARLAERLGLPGLPLETARTVADKRRMRKAFDKARVRCPRGREASVFEEAEQAFHELGAPVVVKPVDGSAQRGVTEVRGEGELAPAFDRALAASRTGAVVLEQYLDGDEYTVNGFLLEGEYFPMSVTRRLLHPPPPLGVCISHRYPSLLRTRTSCSRRRTPRAARSGSDRAFLRPGRVQDGVPGSSKSAHGSAAEGRRARQLVTGFDAVRANVLWALGEPPGDLERAEPVRAAARSASSSPSRPDRPPRRNGGPGVDGVHEAGFYWREGMTLPPLTSGAERLGYLLVSADDEDELDARTSRALEALDVEIAVETLV